MRSQPIVLSFLSLSPIVRATVKRVYVLLTGGWSRVSSLVEISNNTRLENYAHATRRERRHSPSHWHWSSRIRQKRWNCTNSATYLYCRRQSSPFAASPVWSVFPARLCWGSSRLSCSGHPLAWPATWFQSKKGHVFQLKRVRTNGQTQFQSYQ